MSEITPTVEQHYRLLVEGMKNYAMILMDEGGRITRWNMGAEQILGWSEGEVLGQPADLIFTPEDRTAGVPAQEMERAKADDRALDLRWHLRKDGSRFFADGILEGLRDKNGEPCGFAKVMRDATEQKQAQDALRWSEERYRLLVEGAEMGTWRMDMRTGATNFSPRMADIHLFPETVDASEVTLSYDTVMAMVYPDDRARVDESIKRAIAEAGSFRMEHRVVGRGGQVRWIEGHGRSYSGEDGRPPRLEGVALDITERKRAEEALRQSEARYRAVIEALTEGITVQDATGLFQEANTSAERILALSRDQMAGRTSAARAGAPSTRTARSCLARNTRRWSPCGQAKPCGTC